MYLWHGWWPNDEDSESRASTTGSAETRWSNDRRLAMETIKSYAQGTVLFSPTTITIISGLDCCLLERGRWPLIEGSTV